MIEKEEKNIKGELIGVDYGGKRVGIARINTIVSIFEPLEPLENGGDLIHHEVYKIAVYNSASGIVVGLPRGLDGQETEQTRIVRNFAGDLKGISDVPVYLIDEAGTSKEAEKLIDKYKIKSIDSISAGLMLNDFINFKEKESLEI